jgi:hypothetical protein
MGSCLSSPEAPPKKKTASSGGGQRLGSGPTPTAGTTTVGGGSAPGLSASNNSAQPFVGGGKTVGDGYEDPARLDGDAGAKAAAARAAEQRAQAVSLRRLAQPPLSRLSIARDRLAATNGGRGCLGAKQQSPTQSSSILLQPARELALAWDAPLVVCWSPLDADPSRLLDLRASAHQAAARGVSASNPKAGQLSAKLKEHNREVDSRKASGGEASLAVRPPLLQIDPGRPWRANASLTASPSMSSSFVQKASDWN